VLPSAKENRIASSGVQEFRSSGVQGFRGSGVQGFRGSGVQGFRGSGVQGFRGSGVQGGARRNIARKKRFCDTHPRLTWRYRSGLLNSCNSLNS